MRLRWVHSLTRAYVRSKRACAYGFLCLVVRLRRRFLTPPFSHAHTPTYTFSPSLSLCVRVQALIARFRSVGAASGAPKLVAVVSLCPNLVATAVQAQLLAAEGLRLTSKEGVVQRRCLSFSLPMCACACMHVCARLDTHAYTRSLFLSL
jgi:hypothetical protein